MPVAVIDFVLGEEALESVVGVRGARFVDAVWAKNGLKVAVLDGDAKVGAVRFGGEEEAVLARYLLLKLEGEAALL